MTPTDTAQRAEKRATTKSPSRRPRVPPRKLAARATNPRIKGLSKEQLAAAKALHLRGKDLEDYLAEEAELERREKQCRPDTLYPNPGIEHPSTATFGRLRDGLLDEARLQAVYGDHIKACHRCTGLYEQAKSFQP